MYNGDTLRAMLSKADRGYAIPSFNYSCIWDFLAIIEAAEIALGMGIHGEPGIRNTNLLTAEELVDEIKKSSISCSMQLLKK